MMNNGDVDNAGLTDFLRHIDRLISNQPINAPPQYFDKKNIKKYKKSIHKKNAHNHILKRVFSEGLAEYQKRQR
jgi:hypothetical protein